MAFEVICATTDESSEYDDCRCITEIGYEVGDLTRKQTPARIHDKIKGGTDFYVEYRSSKTYLVPVENDGTKYVRTEPNDTKQDNLLKIGDC